VARLRAGGGAAVGARRTSIERFTVRHDRHVDRPPARLRVGDDARHSERLVVGMGGDDQHWAGRGRRGARGSDGADKQQPRYERARKAVKPMSQIPQLR
jgi:hypothetical protein